MTVQPNARIRFRRAIERRALWMAEDAARELPELPELPLEDALQLVHLYADQESPKYERAALRWRERYLAESLPSLASFAKVVATLAARSPPSRVVGEPLRERLGTWLVSPPMSRSRYPVGM